MPTGSTIFITSKVPFGLNDCTKKLKYLKKPNRPRLMQTLMTMSRRRIASSRSFSSRMPSE